MSHPSEQELFGWLTKSRERSFAMAINSFNQFHSASIHGKQHVYDHVKGNGKTMASRAWSIAHIADALTGDSGAMRMRISNMDGIQFDKKVFLRFG